MANETEKSRRVSRPRRVPRPQTSNEPMPPKLKILITVVNRNKAEVYLALLQSFEINMQLAMAAEGTADTTMLNYLGLTDRDKAVIFSVIREDKEEAALRYLDEKFRTIKNGKGIAFTVPMTGVIGVAIYQFLSNHTEGRG
ncbi:MAG: hypothetical protein E7618_06925 [Ruminococcaceae bacterium]|nr:hypothetical protein [Oscillospiraceae bacterium]